MNLWWFSMVLILFLSSRREKGWAHGVIWQMFLHWRNSCSWKCFSPSGFWLIGTASCCFVLLKRERGSTKNQKYTFINRWTLYLWKVFCHRVEISCWNIWLAVTNLSWSMRPNNQTDTIKTNHIEIFSFTKILTSSAANYMSGVEQQHQSLIICREVLEPLT